MTLPTVHVLLPVHNRREITRGCLQCLQAQSWPNLSVLLIDDGSQDGTAELARTLLPDIVVLRGDGHWWWAGSLQQGLNALAARNPGEDEVVLFMNDDSRFGPDFIAQGMAALSRVENTLVQGTIRCADSGDVVDRGYVFEPETLGFRPVRSDEHPNCLTTNGLFARWHDLRWIGNFHPRLLPHYLSDYEFTWRAGRRGLSLHVAPDVELHWNRTSTGYRNIEARSTAEFLSKLFSPRYPSNPIYTTVFTLLTCPLPLALRHAWRIWREALDTWAVWRRELGAR